MGGNEKNEIFRQMRRELKYFNTLSRETIYLEDDGYLGKVLNILSENKYLILAKTRQMMISTLLCAHAIKKALLNKNHTVLFITFNNDSKKEAMNKLNNILSHSSISSTSKENKIRLYGGGDIIFSTIRRAEDLSGLRADTIIIDEAAYYEELEESLSILVSKLNIGPDAQLILASTPKHNSYFNYLFLSVSNNPSIYTAKKLVYKENPYMMKEKITALSRSFYKDEELLCIVTHDEFINRTRLTTLRAIKELLSKVKEKLKKNKYSIAIAYYLRRLVGKFVN